MTSRLNPQLIAGLLFVLIGAAFLLSSLDLSYGTWRKIGPGAFPGLVASALIAMGVIVAFTAEKLNAGKEQPSLYSSKVTFIIAAIVVFGLVIRGGGLLPAVFCSCVISSLASRPLRPVKSMLYGLGLGTACSLAFIKGLGMPIAIIGPWFGL
ncbi:tripartite tricarboxylate transporter TctB family protein [Neorhizobium galegae]|uniref:Tripartite tricarboxylate transporter TctB family protein n=1 Tax=Neorhizobium galegae TaxID=399 RepID=A0A6A1TJD4_NEOGA|nr:tripartite tricarboxylate transporter TctB family protein [Neorhizobium galegae]KAB1083137.1 tripartite tricarboxylate transporter TctB family protein [Neorhizobium galegae]